MWRPAIKKFLAFQSFSFARWQDIVGFIFFGTLIDPYRKQPVVPPPNGRHFALLPLVLACISSKPLLPVSVSQPDLSHAQAWSQHFLRVRCLPPKSAFCACAFWTRKGQLSPLLLFIVIIVAIVGKKKEWASSKQEKLCRALVSTLTTAFSSVMQLRRASSNMVRNLQNAGTSQIICSTATGSFCCKSQWNASCSILIYSQFPFLSELLCPLQTSKALTCLTTKGKPEDCISEITIMRECAGEIPIFLWCPHSAGPRSRPPLLCLHKMHLISLFADKVLCGIFINTECPHFQFFCTHAEPALEKFVGDYSSSSLVAQTEKQCTSAADKLQRCISTNNVLSSLNTHAPLPSLFLSRLELHGH